MDTQNKNIDNSLDTISNTIVCTFVSLLITSPLLACGIYDIFQPGLLSRVIGIAIIVVCANFWRIYA